TGRGPSRQHRPRHAADRLRVRRRWPHRRIIVVLPPDRAEDAPALVGRAAGLDAAAAADRSVRRLIRAGTPAPRAGPAVAALAGGWDRAVPGRARGRRVPRIGWPNPRR